MGLLETLKAVKQDGFDPRKDRINGNGGGLLPTGGYPVRLISAERAVNKANREQIVVSLEVVSGEYQGRKEMIFLGFDDDLPEFVLEKNGKILMAIAEFSDITLTNKDLADEESTAEALKRGIGKQFKMDLKVVPNKKNPDYPYRNYDFESLEDAAFNDDGDDLPF